jgi:choice-of-anchor C domain-containing protein
MRTPRRVACPVLAALVACALAAGASRASLVVNGSFEAGPDPDVMMRLEVGSTAMPGWTVTRNGIDYCGTCWQAANGARSLGLNGAAPGGVAQSIATVPGGEYTVRFSMIGDAFSNPILKHMRVMAAGQSQDYEVDAGHAWPWDMGWLERTFVFEATASSTLLEFMSLDSGDQGPTLDSVVVTLTSTANAGPGTSGALALAAPWPTPARGTLHLSFTLPVEGEVRLSVHDLAGREVAVLDDGVRAAGPHALVWDGRAPGGRLRAGLYVVRLDAAGETVTRKAVIAP